MRVSRQCIRTMPSGYLFTMLLLISSYFFTPPGFARTDPQLTAKLIEQRLATLRDEGSAEDSEVVKTYEQARGFLTEAESSQQAATQYLEAMTTAPQRQAEIQSRIDDFETGSKPKPDLSKLDSAELETLLVKVRAELQEANNNIDTLDRQLSARETNAASSRSRLTEIGSLIDELPRVVLVVDPAAQPSQAEAQRWRNSAQYLALVAERRELDARLNSQAVRYSAMAVVRAEHMLQVERLSQQLRELESYSHASVAGVVDIDALGVASGDPAYTLIERITENDAQLRAESIVVNANLSDAHRLAEEFDQQSRALGERFATARRVVDFASESEVLGRVLLAYWAEIDEYRPTTPTGDISEKAGGTVIRRIELEEILKPLFNATAFINLQLQSEGIDPGTISSDSHKVLLNLVQGYRERLRSTIDAQSDYLETLDKLGKRSLGLNNLIKEYETSLKSLILWIPAFPPLWEVDGRSVSKEFTDLAITTRNTRLSPSFVSLLSFLLFGFLLAKRSQFIGYQDSLNKRISRPRDDAIIYTLLALFYTALRALPVPVLLMAFANVISEEMPKSVLLDSAVSLFVLLFVRFICSREGLGQLHFGWRTTVTKRIYRDLGGLIYYWLPLAALASFIVSANQGIGNAVLARGSMLALLILPLGIIISSLVKETRNTDSHWLSDTSNRVRLIFLVILLIIITAVVLGHVYSVTVIFSSLLATTWIGICVLLAHVILKRWLSVTRRKLRLAELIEAREEKAREGKADTEEIIVDEHCANLGDVSSETGQLINVVTFSVATVLLVYVWSPLLPVFFAFDSITLWTSTTTVEGVIVENRITLATLMIIALLTSLTIFAARKLPSLIDLILRSRTHVSVSARYTVSTLVNYVIMGGGIIAAFSALGLQWSQLQWLVAAMGVGIGFGLQEIIANFFSGLIILFERPIRVGDIVSTGGDEGVVTRIRIRATTICDWDGKELLVPNKEFITGRLLNWSLSNPKIRTVLPVGIAYGSDVEAALKILNEIVSNHPRVIEDPAPQIVFESFGDDALMLSARAYLDSSENRLGVVTEMNREIYKRFTEEGIIIAFPQRDIHIDAEKPIRITLENPANESGHQPG